MTKAIKFALLVAVVATPALAQDSVSNSFGDLPGDGLDAWSPATQCSEFVVDLTPFTSSWGNDFYIAPLIKSSKSNTGFFTSLTSAQSISRLHALDVDYAAQGYAFWDGDPNNPSGQGVNPQQNDAPGVLNPTALSNQFAVTFAEFGTTDDAKNYNGVVGGIVNYDPLNPNRLYVKRVLAATNGIDNTEDRSQFGVGSVDEWGNVVFRADGYQTAGPNSLNGQNVFHVDLFARDCAVNNYIDNNGLNDAAAGNWVVQQAGTNYNVPNMGPASVFGQPYFLGSNWNKQYAYGPVGGSFATTVAHRPGTSDHRGSNAYITRNIEWWCGTHGTAATLTKSTAGGGATDSISVWTVASDGSVGSARTYTLPTDPVNPSIFDNCTGVNNFPGANEFDHYHDQVAFRGGVSQVALGKDQDGAFLAAAVVYQPAVANNNPLNYIAVVRESQAHPGDLNCDCVTDFGDINFFVEALVSYPGGNGWPYCCPYLNADINGDGAVSFDDINPFVTLVVGGDKFWNCDPEWAMAAYSTDGTAALDSGKEIVDAAGTPIGRLAQLFQVTGGDPLGPSMSGPMFDSVGNLYFLSAILDFGPDGIEGTDDDDYDSGLVRGVYDAENFCWTLELVLTVGDVFEGQNSGVPYMITFLGIADGDSVSSGTAWSSNIAELGKGGLLPARDLPTSDPTTMGGMVLSADIVYDVSGDGIFNDPTSANYDPAQPKDESYNVLLYIGS